MSVRALTWISTGAMRLAGSLLISLLMLNAALAQDADPPGRVARLSFLQGAVSLQPAGQQDWVTAELNRPLTTNDRVWSDAAGSRAELDLGGAVVRLGSGTSFSFLNLDDSTTQMQVGSGTVVVHVRELLENQTYEVDTPNVAFLLDEPGQYRIDVNDTGDTTVMRVSDGQAEASGGGQNVPIANQEMVSFFGTDQLSIVPGALGAPDGLDDWSFERDREMDQPAAQQYVADGTVGAEDLDDNGEWQNTPDYGYVWVPTAVAIGWAPYSFGHWAWVSPWGWTWIDDAPWGFAPFHYGRWARWHNSWAWVPGPRNAHPVYAPALVAWAGTAGSAGVAWFPLAPREVYVPVYRVTDRYVRSVNVTNTSITDYAYINNVYQNRAGGIRYANSAVPGAVTSVSRNVFTNAQPVNVHRSVLSATQVAQLAPTSRAPSIAPIRQSVLGGAAPGLARRPPPTVLNHGIVARTAPPAAVGVRVRLVGSAVQQGPATQQGRAFPQGPVPQQTQRAPGFNRPGLSAAPQAAPQTRPPVQPAEAPPVDNRSWAERAHALGQSSLPPAAPRANPNNSAVHEYNDENYHPENYRPGGVRPQELSNDINPSSSGEEERPSQSQQTRSSGNNSSHVPPAQSQSHVEEEYRATPVTPPASNYQRPPETHYMVPPPPPAGAPKTTITPIRPVTPVPTEQHALPHHDEHGPPPPRVPPPPHAPARNDQYPH